MKLQKLVQQANTTYDLGLNNEGIETMCSQLRRTGFNTVIAAGTASRALDAILSISDETAEKTPNSVYASLKVEASPQISKGTCDRCSGTMQQIKLVGNRPAAYCQACSIALPYKTES